MSGGRVLIVNADDLGMSHAVDEGIIHAHREGIVTSASLMVHGVSAARAIARAREEAPGLGLGLHLDFGHWDHDTGEWLAAYLRPDLEDADAVKAELEAQLQAFTDMTGKAPTHLDSHQHVHREEPLRSMSSKAAAGLGAPLRDLTPGVRYEGGFYGQTGAGEPLPDAITPGALCALIDSLEPGVTELGCHPGLGMGSESSYAAEREAEVEALCHPSARDAIQRGKVNLVSFAALRDLGCDIAQGYHYARPMAAEAMTELLGRVGTIHDEQVPAGS